MYSHVSPEKYNSNIIISEDVMEENNLLKVTGGPNI